MHVGNSGLRLQILAVYVLVAPLHVALHVLLPFRRVCAEVAAEALMRRVRGDMGLQVRVLRRRIPAARVRAPVRPLAGVRPAVVGEVAMLGRRVLASGVAAIVQELLPLARATATNAVATDRPRVAVFEGCSSGVPRGPTWRAK